MRKPYKTVRKPYKHVPRGQRGHLAARRRICRCHFRRIHLRVGVEGVLGAGRQKNRIHV